MFNKVSVIQTDTRADAEVLLAQIIYLWTTYLLMPHDGRFWIVQPRRELMKANGLTPTRYKRAIEVLTRQGEIEVFIPPLPISGTHLRLLKRFTDVEEIPWDDERNPPGPFGKVRGSDPVSLPPW